ncbi:MAG: hypothetical protein ACTHK5_06880 [Tsuneonella sp.]
MSGIVRSETALRASFLAFAGLVAFAAEPGSEAAPVTHALARPHLLAASVAVSRGPPEPLRLVDTHPHAVREPASAAAQRVPRERPVVIASLTQAAPIARAPLVRLDPGLPLVAQGQLVARANPPALASAVPVPPTPTVQLAAAHRDERAYVPQITDGGREAYIAQLGIDSSPVRMAVRMDGKVLGKVAFQVADGEVSVRVGQVLDLFESGFDAERFAALRSSAAADQFVSLERIQRAGVPLHYDPVYDELVLFGSSG